MSLEFFVFVIIVTLLFIVICHDEIVLWSRSVLFGMLPLEQLVQTANPGSLASRSTEKLPLGAHLGRDENWMKTYWVPSGGDHHLSEAF